MSKSIFCYPSRSSSTKMNVLSHLNEFRFSSVAVLKEVLGFSLSGTYKVLSRLENEGFILSRVIPELNFKVYGLTDQGVCECWSHEKEGVPDSSFDLRNVPLLTLKHALSIQLVKIRRERLGWHSFVREQDLPRGWKKYPDGLMTSPEGRVNALELELHVKSRKRIGLIMYAHLKAISAGKYDLVLYVCPDEIFAEKLKLIFYAINQITVGGRKVLFDARHHSKFVFEGIDRRLKTGEP